MELFGSGGRGGGIGSGDKALKWCPVAVQVASMEAQLGRLAGVIRTKDAEAAALNAAVQRQFAERTELRGQVAVLDGQVAQLRGATADLEARLRDSEAHCAALDAKHNRCADAVSAP